MGSKADQVSYKHGIHSLDFAVSPTKPSVSISNALSTSFPSDKAAMIPYRLRVPKASDCSSKWTLTFRFRSSGVRVWVLMSAHWLEIHKAEWFSCFCAKSIHSVIELKPFFRVSQLRADWFSLHSVSLLIFGLSHSLAIRRDYAHFSSVLAITEHSVPADILLFFIGSVRVSE